MNKSDKIIVFFYIFLAISFSFFVMFSSEGLENNPFKSVTPQKITDFETNSLIDVPKETIFNEMTNIENYPRVLPQNVVNVKIQSQSNNVIIAEEELSEAGINVKLLVKHTIESPDKHIIEIIDGDAKGTTITQSFESVNSKTNLNTTVHLDVKGLLSLVQYLPESNLIHAINTVNSIFIDYSIRDIYERQVDLIYHEILNRPVDPEGLTYFSDLLRNKQISENEIRSTLLSSDEYNTKIKSIDELSLETKNIINNLYNKLLLRDADPVGLKYFGNLLESGTTSDEIRMLFLESDEWKNASIFHPVRTEIQDIFTEFFDREPSMSELNYYHKMIDDGILTMEEIETEFKNSDEFDPEKIIILP